MSHAFVRLAAAATLLLAPLPLGAQTVPSPSDERVGDLVRTWYFARLFHPAAADPAVLDASFAANVAAAREAPDDAVLARVIATMLSPLGDAPTSTPAPTSATKSPDPAFRAVGDIPIASCTGIAALMMANGTPDEAIRPVAALIEARGLVLDCRGFAVVQPNEDDGARYYQAYHFRNWLTGAIGSRLTRPLPAGAQRLRYHDGYATELGSTSGGYTSGTLDAALPPFPGTGGPAARKMLPLVVLVDQSTPNVTEFFAPLQAAGLARIVAQGDAGSGSTYRLRLKHASVDVRTGDYVYPDGRLGLRPDACVAAGRDDEALKVAITALAGSRVPACPNAAPSQSPATTPRALEPLGLGERMIALGKWWGAIEYFYPYKGLLDQPWGPVLDAAVPSFLSAETRTAYDDAMLILAAKVQDTHVNVRGIQASSFGQKRFSPALYVRPVEKGFAIAGLHDPALASRVRVGDEIVTVDGRTPAEIMAEARRYMGPSTPQSLAGLMSIYLLAGGEKSDAKLTLRRAGGATVEATLPRAMRAGLASQRPADTSPTWKRIAPDIGYIDLARLPLADADTAVDQLLGTRGLVLDLRGYPQGTAWTIAPRIATEANTGAVNALFRRPQYLGPSKPQEAMVSFEQRLPTTTKPRYTGKVVVLIDDRAISQSEHSAMMFAAARPVTFVGTPTTGANGDVTNVVVPGGLSVSFSGHDVRHPDGRQLQRIGIQPDIRVAPTWQGLRAGRDEVLEAGLKAVRK